MCHVYGALSTTCSVFRYNMQAWILVSINHAACFVSGAVFDVDRPPVLVGRRPFLIQLSRCCSCVLSLLPLYSPETNPSLTFSLPQHRCQRRCGQPLHDRDDVVVWHPHLGPDVALSAGRPPDGRPERQGELRRFQPPCRIVPFFPSSSSFMLASKLFCTHWFFFFSCAQVFRSTRELLARAPKKSFFDTHSVVSLERQVHSLLGES